MKRVVIEGIAETSSSGAVMDGDRWRGVGLFRPWRIGRDGALSDETLHVSFPARATGGEARRDSKRVKNGVAYRFSADLHPPRPNMLRAAELRGRLERVAADTTLATADAAAAATIRIKDPILGSFVRRPRQQQFEGRLTLFGRKVPTYIDGPVERASTMFAGVRAKLRDVPAVVARKMLPLANRVWLDRPISEHALRRRLKPTELWLDKSGVLLIFSCDDTFGDHGVAVRLSARGAVQRIQLQ